MIAPTRRAPNARDPTAAPTMVLVPGEDLPDVAAAGVAVGEVVGEVLAPAAPAGLVEVGDVVEELDVD
jgi:hypothetical protein